MRKFLAILLIVCTFNFANATTVIVVNATKLNGDGSGKYDYTYKNVTPHNETASAWIQIDIFCQGAGPNNCPKPFIPVLNSDPMIEDAIDMSVIAGCEELFNLIIEKSNVGVDYGTEFIQVTVTGSGLVNSITANWITEDDGTVKITYTIDQVN